MYSASTNAVTGTTNRPPRRTLGDLRNTLLVPRTLEDYGYQKLELIAEGMFCLGASAFHGIGMIPASRFAEGCSVTI